MISVEGNDVATNLKWALLSRSVVLMPHPQIETFFGEGLLQPYQHYIPLNVNTSNLVDQIQMCEKRTDKCQSIAESGRNFAMAHILPTASKIYDHGSVVLERHFKKIWNLK